MGWHLLQVGISVRVSAKPVVGCSQSVFWVLLPFCVSFVYSLYSSWSLFPFPWTRQRKVFLLSRTWVIFQINAGQDPADSWSFSPTLPERDRSCVLMSAVKQIAPISHCPLQSSSDTGRWQPSSSRTQIQSGSSRALL